MKIKSFLLTLLITLSLATYAQNKEELTSSVPKAVRAFETALKYYDGRLNQKAVEALDEAIEADPKFVEAHTLKGNILSDMKEYEKAIASYKNAITASPDFFPNTYYSLGKLQYRAGHYEEAKSSFTKFLSYDKISPGLKQGANVLSANCDFAINAVKNPVAFDPTNMGDSINSKEDEYFPSFTVDGQSLLFTRKLPSGRTFQEDFYKSELKGASWSFAKAVTELNTPANEGASFMTADGQYLFFASCEELGNPDSRPTKGSCDIFIAKKVGDKFMNPRDLLEPLNSGGWESQPSFSTDGRTIYFVKKVKEASNQTHTDIYISQLDDKANWSVPVSVSDKINTKMNESAVFIHPDDQTLYFTSNGHPGMGGEDIFYSRRQIDGTWGDPVNLGYPINTVNDEFGFAVSPDAKTGYFVSDRPGGLGGLDLYSFPLYESARPKIVTYMKGRVFDIETNAPLDASFELIDLGTGKVMVRSVSDSKTGEFLLCLPTGKQYALNVSRSGYLFYSDHFELKDPATASKPVKKDIPLKPIKAGQTIVLNNIFYETDKFDLKPESKIELDRLVSFLNNNPKVHFEISGHTDNVGGKEYNKTLSEKRAKTVYDYLVTAGIPATRMSSKGFGDTVPVAENTSDAGRAKNRRTEFKVTSLDN